MFLFSNSLDHVALLLHLVILPAWIWSKGERFRVQNKPFAPAGADYGRLRPRNRDANDAPKWR